MPPLSLAHPLLSPILNITYYISAVLHGHYNVLISTAIENCSVLWDGTHNQCWGVYSLYSRPVNTGTPKFFRSLPHELLPSTFKIMVGPDVFSLNWLFVWSTHFSDASVAYAWVVDIPCIDKFGRQDHTVCLEQCPVSHSCSLWKHKVNAHSRKVASNYKFHILSKIAKKQYMNFILP